MLLTILLTHCPIVAPAMCVAFCFLITTVIYTRLDFPAKVAKV